MFNTITRTAGFLVAALTLTVAIVSTSAAQFPSGNSPSAPAAAANPLAGAWQVTNHEDLAIRVEINEASQFRMSVNGEVSGGQLEATDRQITLKFSDGTVQEFSYQTDGTQMILASADGANRFELARINPTAPRNPPAGLDNVFGGGNGPNRPVAQSPSSQLEGDWYFQANVADITVVGKTSFRPDGTYTSTMIMSGRGEKQKMSETGTWSIQNNQITTSSEETGTESVEFQFVGENLVIDMTAELGQPITLSRTPDSVQALNIQVPQSGGGPGAGGQYPGGQNLGGQFGGR